MLSYIRTAADDSNNIVQTCARDRRFYEIAV